MELKESLQQYIEQNEVVYQASGDLVEVANESNKENRDNLLRYLRSAYIVDIFKKNDQLVKNNFQELNDWCVDDDVLFFLYPIGVLVCVTKNEAVKNNLIASPHTPNFIHA